MSTAKLIDRLEQILPGIQNSNSAAEVAMVEALPEVIARLGAMERALEEIRDTHVPDQPAANDCSDADYVRSHHRGLRLIARKALESSQ